MAPHVEEAKERLIALNKPVPEPTPEALAENEAEMQSLINIKLKDRAMLLVKTGPSTIQASRVGEPTMTDPARTTAPEVSNRRWRPLTPRWARPRRDGATTGTPAAVTRWHRAAANRRRGSGKAGGCAGRQWHRGWCHDCRGTNQRDDSGGRSSRAAAPGARRSEGGAVRRMRLRCLRQRSQRKRRTQVNDVQNSGTVAGSKCRRRRRQDTEAGLRFEPGFVQQA